MKRRTFLSALSVAAAAPFVGGLSSFPRWAPGGSGGAPRGRGPAPAGGEPDFERLEKSEEEWRRILTDAEFRVLREEATERPHSSPLNEEKRAGTFICAGCYLPLFRSEDKFMSGTGWPSFTRPIEGRMETKKDFKLIWPRTEYHCARCGGHQGHVFDDGPPPTGQRWCNNGAALDFVPEGEELPELRT